MITVNAKGICVVTVTYGDRGKLLQQVLSALDASTVKIDRVVVVDNGSINSLENISLASGGIDIVSIGSNAGSAVGFKAGLQRALATGCELIWLLDDDNVPESDALEELLLERESLGNNENHIFASLRLDREKYVRAATTDSTLEIKVNSFLGFNISVSLKRLWQKLAGKKLPKSDSHFRVKELGYGIYGGLFFHRSWLGKVGFPEESFYLYMDDTEYTSRLVHFGAHIYLVPKSKIRDIDITWSQKSSKNLPLILDLGIDTKKLYYTLRNSCYLSRYRFVDNRGLFYLNMISFLSIMFLWGICAGNSLTFLIRRFRLVITATLEGINGKLGYRETIPGESK